MDTAYEDKLISPESLYRGALAELRLLLVRHLYGIV